MKIKQLVILFLIAAGLGAAVWHLNKDSKETGGASSGTAGGKVVAFPVEKVTQLSIQSSEGTVNLVQKGDAWTVQERADFPANAERVENLLRKLWDLKTVQEMQVGPSQFTRFDLTDPAQAGGTATRADFKDKDGKALAALLVGKKFMRKSDAAPSPFGGDGGFPAGRYVRTPGSTKVALISDTLDDVDPKAPGWLKRDFFKIENPTSIALEGATDAQKWKLTRATAAEDWKIAGAAATEKADQAKISQVASAFAVPAFTDVLNPDAKPADTGLDKPLTATIATFDGFTYVLKIGKETGGNQPVTVAVSAQFAKERTPAKDEKPGDKTKLDDEFKAKLKKLEDKLAAEKKFEGRAFLIARTSIDSLVKDRTSLLEEKKPDAAPGTPLQPPGGAPATPMFPPPVPPTPSAPSAKAPPTPPAPQAPITVTTPPIAVPPMPAESPKTPAKPESPISVTTPPVSLPPAADPAKPKETPKTPDKPQPPAAPPAQPAMPTPPAPQPAPGK